MSSRSLTRQFLLLVSVALLVVALAFAWVIYRGSVHSRRGQRLGDLLGETIELNRRLRSDIHSQVELIYEYLDDPAPAIEGRFEELHLRLGESQVEYLRMDVGAVERRAVVRIRDRQQELARQGSLAMSAIRGGDRGTALERLAEMERIQARIDDAFEVLSGIQLQKLRATWADADEAIRGTFGLLLGIVALQIGLVVVVAYLVRWRVQKPLSALLLAARKMRHGDLSARSEVARDDEIGQVAREFNFMARALQESHADLEKKVEERTREIRELQEQLVQSERLSAVGELVGGVAHELNNPLTAILGFGELGLEAARKATDGGERSEFPPGSDAADDSPSVEDVSAVEAFEEILQQAERCRRIVEDLLQFVRRRETELEPVPLNGLLEGALRLRDYEARTHGIEIERDFDASEPEVLADPYKLEQVVLALVNNAIDAIQAAGDSGHIVVSTSRRDDRAVLEVSDTGPGVEEPERVFEPFYTTKEVGEGTGLGLSVAYGIVSEHGGEIRCDRWERGARFVVELPLSAGDGEEETDGIDEVESIGDVTSTDGRIALLVDDEEPILGLQKRFLRRLGLEADTVRSGADAIERLEERAYDLVVCDVRMPGRLDGKDVYEWVRRHRPELAERFIFTTGDLHGLEERIEELPGPCLAKPFDLATYRQAVRRVLESKERRS